MHAALPFYLLTLVVGILPVHALPELGIRERLASSIDFPRRLWSTSTPLERRLDAQSGVNFNPNGSAFLWLPEDDFSGNAFFDAFDFFSAPDPTNGHVNFVNSTDAFSRGLAYVDGDGKVVMKADNFTDLPQGTFRDSVRVTGKKQYNTGLFILDLNRAPWGCAVWPAFWTVGPNWPLGGEIDVLEGVHDNEHNQIAWHTDNGCFLDPNITFTGTVATDSGVNRTNCWGMANSNSGCDVTEWSVASYGPNFEAQGGGVIAMKWDENDISVWSFFRAAIPKDITAGTPNPSQWGLPSASLTNTSCNIGQYFSNHSIVFDITFCGDWAGSSYATSGCPGTCDERLMTGANFVNATFNINSLTVYKKQLISDLTSSSESSRFLSVRTWQVSGLISSVFAAMVLL